MSAVLELIQELATYEKAPDAVIISAEDLINYGFGARAHFQCFVAEIETEIVGMALCYPRFSTWVGPALHLEDLIVREAYRRYGIGKKLYDRVLEYALEIGANRVEWAVLAWNNPAIEFYKKSGALVHDEWRIAQFSAENIAAYLNSKQ